MLLIIADAQEIPSATAVAICLTFLSMQSPAAYNPCTFVSQFLSTNIYCFSFNIDPFRIYYIYIHTDKSIAL